MLRAFGGQAATCGNRLGNGHVALEPVRSGALHFAVDVEQRRARNVERIAGRDRRILSDVPVEQRMQIDRGLGAARSYQDGLIRGDGANRSTGLCQQIERGAGRRQGVLPGSRDLSHDRDLLTLILGDQDRDLRLVDVAALVQAPDQKLLQIPGRQPDCMQLAEQRKGDVAGLADPRIHGQFRVVEHVDLEQIVGSDFVVAGLGRRRRMQHPHTGCREKGRGSHLPGATHDGEHATSGRPRCIARIRQRRKCSLLPCPF